MWLWPLNKERATLVKNTELDTELLGIFDLRQIQHKFLLVSLHMWERSKIDLGMLLLLVVVLLLLLTLVHGFLPLSISFGVCTEQKSYIRFACTCTQWVVLSG